MTRILAVGAHPDDIEILCAGTLARYRAGGSEVGMCVMTDGGLGAPDGTTAAAVTIRREEARRSAAHLDARSYFLDEADGFLYDTPGLRTEFVEVLRDFRPGIVLAPSPHDYHPDHRAASAVVTATLQLAASPLLPTTSPPITRAPVIFFMDSLALIDPAPPEILIDISATLETKLQMLAEHRSQNDWLRCTDATDYGDYVRRQAALRGLQCGVQAAEGFRAYRTFPIAAAPALPGLPEANTGPALTMPQKEKTTW